MPIFEYKCTDCESRYEIFHKTRETENDVLCPSCGSMKHKKLMSAPTISMSSYSSSYSSQPSSSCEDAPGGSCCMGGACGMN